MKMTLRRTNKPKGYFELPDSQLQILQKQGLETFQKFSKRTEKKFLNKLERFQPDELESFFGLMHT